MYLLSTRLAYAIYEQVRDDKLPWHIPYPYDDAMIGMWVYRLGPPVSETDVPWYDVTKTYADVPEKDGVKVDKWGNPFTIDTIHVVGDKVGFHDPFDHSWDPYIVDWDTVLIHKITAKEMRGLRLRPEYKDEWVKSVD
jgi:hypothetical protein